MYEVPNYCTPPIRPTVCITHQGWPGKPYEYGTPTHEYSISRRSSQKSLMTKPKSMINKPTHKQSIEKQTAVDQRMEPSQHGRERPFF
jgi:hypothetical protein